MAFGESLPALWEKYRRDGIALPLPPFRYNLLHLVSGFYQPSMLPWSSPIRVDAAKCNRCGRCAAVCPTGRLKPAEFPRISGPCVGCYACVNFCPQDAIDSLLTKGRVRYRGIKEELQILPGEDQLD